MPTAGERPARTLLEALIRARRQTFEEFTEDAERFAREHGESATLSARHVQRLAAGERPDRQPLGPVRPATRRLLESMLDRPIDELLSAPDEPRQSASDVESLRARLAGSRALDGDVLAAFQQRVDIARVVDRRLGAPRLVGDLGAQVRHMWDLMKYASDPDRRTTLAGIIADACALLGWQWLDRAEPATSWECYTQAMSAAAESDSAALRAYVTAGRAIVLLDVGETAAAVEMTEHACASARGKVPALLESWLTAARGEAYAAHGAAAPSNESFDAAERLLSTAPSGDPPYLVFGDVHLARWRGNALARLHDPAAADTLSASLALLDPRFTRAETAVRTDLAVALAERGEYDAARVHADNALLLARRIGSRRHSQRLRRLELSSRPQRRHAAR
jgi:tetratricopeptide (TPR) repeat protein